MASIDDSIQPTHLSKEVDDRYLEGISKLTGSRLSIGAIQVLTMIMEDMEVRYTNYEKSETYKTISSVLEHTGISLKTVQESIYDKLSRQYTAVIHSLEESGVLSIPVRQVVINRINTMKEELNPEYFSLNQ